MRATTSLLRNGFEEEAVTFAYPHARVFADGQSPLRVILDRADPAWRLMSALI
jgi:hypothetical protein